MTASATRDLVRCFVGHATHPDARAALALAAAQVEARRAAARAPAPTLGLVYFSDHHAGAAEELHAELGRRFPGCAWVGAVGVGVAAMGVEYIDEPAVALMTTTLPAAAFRVFSGARQLPRPGAAAAGGDGFSPFAALVHADPATPELAELIGELSQRMDSGYLFGGLAASRQGTVHVADGVWRGGLSGVAFAADVGLVSRVTQGCQPVGPARVVTAADRNVVLALDGEPALPCLLRDIGLADLSQPREALVKLRGTLVGLADAPDPLLARPGQFGTDTRVRHLVGLDPAQEAVAVAERVEPGMKLSFCQRDVAAARRDLVRICSEIRDELAGDERTPARRIAGAVYVSCAGRGGPHFGGPSAELQIVQHALTGGVGGQPGGGADATEGAEVPLVGFFAGGEIARRHLYGYTGVLTVFTAPA